MEFSIKNGNPEKQRSDCLIVGVFEGKKLSASAKLLDDVSEQAISAVVKAGDMQGKLASTVLLHQIPNVNAKRVLLVGLGKPTAFGHASYLKVVRAAIKAIPKSVANVGLYLTELTTAGMSVHEKTAQIAEVVSDATYQINALKSDMPAASLKKVGIYVEKTEESLAKRALAQGLAIAEGVKMAKDLGNLPGNVCTPTYLGKQAKTIS